jgi:iron complex outermembrane receptor protein
MALFIAGGETLAQTQKPKPKLTELSLEELMNVEVTSVSKKEEPLFKSTAAVFVISQEDIRRSGLTSIPELLRMVPGLEVARINSNQWAISARGFNGRFANKMLVLIDGRSVYNLSFSGVFWDMQDTLLEDIERIEVIRGPGASLWGANAVNGVINILTKRAEKTQGVLATLGGGSEERGFAGVRYGGALGSKAAYRIYAKSFLRDQSVDATGSGASDDWKALQGGFRMDWDPSGRDSLTWEGDLYTGEEGQTSLSGVPTFSSDLTSSRNGFSGGNLLARWKRVFSDRSDLSLQIYYDRYSREIGDVSESRDTFDLDFQHRLGGGPRHDIVWGAGYRYMIDNIHFTGRTDSPFSPASRGLNLFSAFVQDEINLVQDRVRLTLGSKFEHNEYTGFEVEPSIRLLWTPRGRHVFWAAVSRAVRTPSRQDTDSLSQGPSASGQEGTPLIEILSLTNTGIRSEVLVAGEIGYRLQASDRLSMDLTAFYGAYSNLKTSESTAPVLVDTPEPPHWVIRQYADYDMLGHTYGVEMAANWRITEAWKLSLGYTHFGIRLQTDASSGAAAGSGTTSGNDPRHQFNRRSHLTLPYNLEWDASLYYVDHLDAGSIPSYIRLDARFGWSPTKNLCVSVVLQNLLQPRHAEFGDSMDPQNSIQVQRGAYGKVTWRF